MADNLDTLAAAVHAQATMAGVAYDVGKLEVERLEEYPRVIWVSEGGSIGPVEHIGGRVSGSSRIRQVRSDNMLIQLHIWGNNREVARDVMHAIIGAIWTECYGCCEFGAYRWITEEAARAEFATHGAKILLEVTIPLPVCEGANALTTITDQGSTTSFVSDLTGSTTVICS